MVYCDSCAIKRKWPTTAYKLKSFCEVCQEDAHCNEYPSMLLCAPKPRVEPRNGDKFKPVFFLEEEELKPTFRRKKILGMG
jgi:hypothetical protein